MNRPFAERFHQRIISFTFPASLFGSIKTRIISSKMDLCIVCSITMLSLAFYICLRERRSIKFLVRMLHGAFNGRTKPVSIILLAFSMHFKQMLCTCIGLYGCGCAHNDNTKDPLRLIQKFGFFIVSHSDGQLNNRFCTRKE